ncbi:hypothetical protein MAR_030600 [Mya arenaria]|uniref:Uncharacterized protein n=1 Tax=Mya arenaria TaxID=6604 RepID=A0ABY7F4M6_MYAAR|nr:hypothetical protein MAR_030600 [Mya arenaria]
MLMMNHTDKDEPHPAAGGPPQRPRVPLEGKNAPRLVEITSNPGTPLKVTEIPDASSTALANIMRTPAGNSTSVVHAKPNSSSIATTQPNANSHSDIVKTTDVIVRDASSVKSSNSISTEQRSANQSPNSSPHASNNLVAVHT